MIVAIMQPYFFPYIGYFQLMRAVDLFVLYDDAQYMKGGWVNRNRIDLQGHPSWITLPVERDSLTTPINKRTYLLGEGIQAIKQKIHAAYKKSPKFKETHSFVSDLLDFGRPNVAEFNCNLLLQIARRLDIRCEFTQSSDLGELGELRGEAKVLEICRRVGADHYVNPIGGAMLYSDSSFNVSGLQLSFLKTATAPTMLSTGPEHLSVIDGLMRAGFDGYRNLLSAYTLLKKCDLRRQA